MVGGAPLVVHYWADLQSVLGFVIVARTWLEVVQRDCQVRELSRHDAMVRGRWRKLIRMVDEQEGCEWMNVKQLCVCSNVLLTSGTVLGWSFPSTCLCVPNVKCQ